jgi:pimeloyl-ACP methyl ester carboxylesterase
MLHGSPGDSEMLTEEIRVCGEKFTVFALDTPGFGYSDALPGEVLTVADLARATAEAMAALGLPPCPVYGTHTGAAIAIELGVGWPELVTGLVMEGLPAFTDAEIEELFKDYFAPMVPDPLGGHFVSTWMRFRDQFTWFPWPSRDVKRLNALDRPAPADIDLWVSMFYRSCKTYKPAYKAACTYGGAALRAAAALRVPAIYMATAEDMLFAHLDRLPALRTGQRIERLGSHYAKKIPAILGFVTEFAGSGQVLPQRQMWPGAERKKGFVDGRDGQIFVRRYGDAENPPVVLLHDAPGTGLGLAEAALALAVTHHVIVPDHPGCGRTDAPEAGDILAVAAGNVLAVADALGLDSFGVAGVGCGAAVAAYLARAAGPRVGRFVLAHVAPADAGRAQKIAPELLLSATGAHWVQAWLMLRDGQIYQPWFEGSIAAQRATQGNFDAAWLHDQTVALMEGRETYHLLPRAAAGCDVAAIFAAGGVPVVSLPGDGFWADLMREIRHDVDA